MCKADEFIFSVQYAALPLQTPEETTLVCLLFIFEYRKDIVTIVNPGMLFLSPAVKCFYEFCISYSKKGWQ